MDITLPVAVVGYGPPVFKLRTYCVVRMRCQSGFIRLKPVEFLLGLSVMVAPQTISPSRVPLTRMTKWPLSSKVTSRTHAKISRCWPRAVALYECTLSHGLVCI